MINGAAMSSYRLHGFCQSGNAYKVALYLELSGIAWEPRRGRFLRRPEPQARLARERQRDGRGAGARSGRPAADAIRRDPYLARRKAWQLRAGQRRRALRGAALDPVRQPQVHELLRHAAVPEMLRAARARPGRAGFPAATRGSHVRDRR